MNISVKISHMKIISIDDPNDLYYPLDKETYWDPEVYYHGTSKQYSTSIEKNGFHLEKVYDAIDVSELYNAFASPYFQAMNFEEMDYHKEDLTYAIGGAGDSVSFSGNYWYARNYSINLGGESIEHIVNVCKWISKLPDCPFQRLANRCLEKYEPLCENHIPCVYVVRLPDDELKEWYEKVKDHKKSMDEQPNKNHNIDHFVFNKISNKSIIARIDFSREIKDCWNQIDKPTKF